MPISFANIPANWKMPLYWVELDSSKAGLPVLNQPALLVGIKLAAGEGTRDVAIPIGTQAQADKQFGQGSHLANMFKAFFRNSFSTEVWGLPVTEPTAGTAATGTITVTTTPPHDAGTIHLYIGGEHIGVSIGSSDTADAVATAIADAIDDEEDLPVTAAAVAGVVTATCKWKGLSGNEIDIRANYFGRVGSEEYPKGVSLAFSSLGQLSGGAGTPSWSGGTAPNDYHSIENLGERQFEFVALPFTDTDSLNQWEAEFNFSDTGRWGWMRQLFGHLFSAKAGTLGDLQTFGNGRNNPQTSIMAIDLESPTPIYEWTAAYTAKAARALSNDPARPLQTLGLEGCKPAPLHDRFNLSELNIMAGNGLATQATYSGIAMIMRETTTYQLNLYGQGDDAYELVTTLATLARLLRNQRHAITTMFPRHKLANDGTRFGPGQAIVTPGLIKAHLLAQYQSDQLNGLVEDTLNFNRNLIVERDINNPNRVNVLYPPDLINQLRVFSVLAQFRLQYDRGLDTQISATTTNVRLAAGGQA